MQVAAAKTDTTDRAGIRQSLRSNVSARGQGVLACNLLADGTALGFCTEQSIDATVEENRK